MSFTSLTFPIFVVVTLGVFCLLPLRLRLPFLLLASYIFYGWNTLAFVPLLIASTCIHYVAGKLLASLQGPRTRFAVAASSIVVDLLILGWFKYILVFIGSSHVIPGVLDSGDGVKPHDLLLPTAISFYTIQSIGYTVDVYRRRVLAETDFARFALYVAFFPQLVAGPIERAHQLLPQLQTLRKPFPLDVRASAMLIAWGFFKKLVVADRLASFCDPILANPTAYTPLQVVIAPYLFMYRLYCDIGGYTDIAIGVAALFGIRLMGNFDRPFVATSVRGMWQRWHISLTRWMMDYVYIPLARRLPSPWGKPCATIAVFVLIGLWHGPSWNYMGFGFLMGLIIVLGDLRRRHLPHPPLLLPERWRPLWSRIAVWTIMSAAIIVFAPPDLLTSWKVLVRASEVVRSWPSFADLARGPPLSPFEWAIIAAGIVTVEVIERFRQDQSFRAALERVSLPLRWASAYGVIFAILMFGEFSSTPFYYFRF